MLILIIYFIIKNILWINKFNLINYISVLIFKENINNNFFINKTLFNIFNSILIIFLLTNLINIFPNIFYISRNIMFSLNFSFFFIIIYLCFNLINNYNIFFLNLTPKSTPIFLIFFINIIEINRFFIQIITLAIRLIINIILGHIIINLINNISLILIYLTIEIFIIFIQSYVFYILILLNSNNIY